MTIKRLNHEIVIYHLFNLNLLLTNWQIIINNSISMFISLIEVIECNIARSCSASPLVPKFGALLEFQILLTIQQGRSWYQVREETFHLHFSSDLYSDKTRWNYKQWSLYISIVYACWCINCSIYKLFLSINRNE